MGLWVTKEGHRAFQLHLSMIGQLPQLLNTLDE
jgi:hypothetical protein